MSKIKVRITQPGALFNVGGEERPLKVGEVLEFEGTDVPDFLRNKADLLSTAEGKALEKGTDLAEELKADNVRLTDLNEKLTKDYSDLTTKVSAVQAELDKVVAEKAAVDAAFEALNGEYQKSLSTTAELNKEITALKKKLA